MPRPTPAIFLALALFLWPSGPAAAETKPEPCQVSQFEADAMRYRVAYAEVQHAAEALLAANPEDPAAVAAARKTLQRALEHAAASLPEKAPETAPEDAISPARLQSLLTAMASAVNSGQRKLLVSKEAQTSRFLVKQAITILETADFDRTKVEIAEILYPRVIDREAWPKIYETLDFDSSKEALRRLLRQRDVPVSQDRESPKKASNSPN